MIQPGDVVAVGVSGGADSVCLLHILWRLQRENDFKPVVVHVDHGVRMDSARDAEYVAQLCRRLDIPFHLKKVDMEEYARSRKLSAEEAGRILRYEAFGDVLGQYGGGKIAVAHNCNDRAETMLFHIFRGSGLKGICSIQPVRDGIIRPLLCLERQEIEEYLEEEKLSYREDSTNGEDSYTRNRIRHHILPYAEREICARAVEHMGGLADLLSETEDYMEEQTKQAYRRCVATGEDMPACFRERYLPDGLALNLTVLKKESEIIQKRIILMCLEYLTPHRKDITGRHVAALAELAGRNGSKTLSLPYGIQAYKEYDWLYLGKIDSKKSDSDAGRETLQAYAVMPPARIEIPKLGSVEFRLLDVAADSDKKEQIIPKNGYTKWFDYDKITTSLQMRTRRPGDYLTVDDSLHTKRVKEYMINEKIPKIQRDSMYILADGPHILWIPGYRSSRYYKADENTRRILQVQLRGGHNGRTD